jgi:hypothetical protein
MFTSHARTQAPAFYRHHYGFFAWFFIPLIGDDVG